MVSQHRLWGSGSVVQGLNWQDAFASVSMNYLLEHAGDHLKQQLGHEHCATAAARRHTATEFKSLCPEDGLLFVYTVLPPATKLPTKCVRMGSQILTMPVPNRSASDTRTIGIPVATRLVGRTYRLMACTLAPGCAMESQWHSKKCIRRQRCAMAAQGPP